MAEHLDAMVALASKRKDRQIFAPVRLEVVFSFKSVRDGREQKACEAPLLCDFFATL